MKHFLKGKKMKRHSIFVSFVGDIGISIFAGIIAYHICSFLNITGVAMACIVGTSSHIATRFVMIFNHRYGVRIANAIKKKGEDNEVKDK